MATTLPSLPVDPGLPPEADLIGRASELESISRLVTDVPLVTLVGPGGVGKTTLATAVARRHTAGPAVICELVPVEDPAGVPATIAEALGFPSIRSAVVGLAGTGRLLVVDNAEHHLDAAAAAVEELVAGCPDLSVLVTSREPLELPAEHVVVLEPLPIPADDDDLDAVTSSPAVQLFVARARAAGATLTLDLDALTSVAAVVRRLDGLPLALELAAARTRGLGLADILRHLDDRFELLVRRHDRGHARHQSLEATIDWSYERLEPEVQRFLARLSAFCGPFPAEAAHAVAAEAAEAVTTTLDRLDRLVSRSLVSTATREGQVYYLVPESIRLYARRQLEAADEAATCDIRCVDHFVQVAAGIADAAHQAWSRDVIEAVLGAHINLKDAIRWCVAHDPSPGRATILFAPLWGLVHLGRAESVLQVGEQILERWPEPRDDAWALTAAVTGSAALSCGDAVRGWQLVRGAFDAAPDSLGAMFAARAAYLAANHELDAASARDWLDRAIAVAERLGFEPLVAEAEVFRAVAMAEAGDRRSAIELADRARQHSLAIGSQLVRVFAELAVGAIVALDDPVRGSELVRRVVSSAERANAAWSVGAGHRVLGVIAIANGDLSSARSHLARSLDTYVAVGQLGEAAWTLRWIAGLFVTAGRPEAASMLLLPLIPTVPLLGSYERDHLDALLHGLSPTEGADVRLAIAAARAALKDLATADAGPIAAADATPDTGSNELATGGAATGDVAVARWIREGAIWELTYGGRTARLPDAKGLADLATLLRRPGQEIGAAELMGAGVEAGDLGPTIDAAARRAYEQRIRDLQEDLEEAEGFGDLRRAERAREELDQLIDALAAATGLAGRSRRQGGSHEKARSAVTRRIRDAMRRIEELHPELGAHLLASVKTGRWCVYAPTEPATWLVDGD